MIPMLFLTLSFANIMVEGLENGQGEMSMSLKEEIKLELMEEMRRELEEKVESLVEKRVDNLRQELEVELLRKLMGNESLWRGATAATSTPQHIICATQDVWYDSSTVAYWDVITDLNTVGKGGLDLNTGQFTAGCGGYYTVTISGSAFTYGGNYIRLHIHRNGERLDESWWVSGTADGEGSFPSYDQGSRTLIYHLDEGDTLEVVATLPDGWSNYAFYNLALCISLTATG